MYNCPLEQLLDYLMKLLVLTTAQNETLDIPKQLDLRIPNQLPGFSCVFSYY